MDTNNPSKLNVLKNFYLYLVSFAALMMIAISSSVLIGDILKLTIFPNADSWYSTNYSLPGCKGSYAPDNAVKMSNEECAEAEEDYKREQVESRKRRLQESFVWSLSVLLVGIPLFGFHWRLIEKNK
jgi:hypothetical protein